MTDTLRGTPHNVSGLGAGSGAVNRRAKRSMTTKAFFWADIDRNPAWPIHSENTMLDPSAYADNFARDHLPPFELWPLLRHADAQEIVYPKRFNAAAELLDAAIARGWGARPAIRSSDGIVSYAELLERANRIAAVLVRDAGLRPGNRVLLRSANNPMLAAAWLGILKAGGIVVATMPLLRARELSYILKKAAVQFAICDARLAGEWRSAVESAPQVRTLYFNNDGADGLEARMAAQSGAFENVIVSHDDVGLIAFTSGTTGSAKATMHFHRDILAVADCFPRFLRIQEDDVSAGSAPFAFTFGLGAMLLFPLRFGASGVLLEQPTPEALLAAIEQHRVTRLFTVPTLYRAMTGQAANHDLTSLRTCISSGEHLPSSVFDAWKKATGLTLRNSIGSTEMLHAFLAMPEGEVRPNAVGKPLPGYEAMVVDDEMKPVPPNTVGRLVVRGPTGCRYLDDADRQKTYVRDGWNLTGDAFLVDDEGYFRYHARADDMIVSAGYNISGAEIEEVLLSHPDVKECAVVGLPDAERGQIVAAFVVLSDGKAGDDAMTKSLQDYVKSSIAPYKYPRAVHYLSALPKTDSGKIQRHVLRQRDA
jgi:2-aminobenzoate-CoA ligase